jgi:hypothetical protein
MPGIHDPGMMLLDDLETLEGNLCETSPIMALLDFDPCIELKRIREILESSPSDWIYTADAVLSKDVWSRLRQVAARILIELRLPYLEPNPVETS